MTTESWARWQQEAPPEAKVALDMGLKGHLTDPTDPEFWWVRTVTGPLQCPPWFPSAWLLALRWGPLVKRGGRSGNTPGVLLSPITPDLFAIRETVGGSLLWARDTRPLSARSAVYFCNWFSFLLGLPPMYRYDAAGLVRVAHRESGLCLASAYDCVWIQHSADRTQEADNSACAFVLSWDACWAMHKEPPTNRITATGACLTGSSVPSTLPHVRLILQTSTHPHALFPR